MEQLRERVISSLHQEVTDNIDYSRVYQVVWRAIGSINNNILINSQEYLDDDNFYIPPENNINLRELEIDKGGNLESYILNSTPNEKNFERINSNNNINNNNINNINIFFKRQKAL